MKIKKRNTSGNAKNFITRTQAVKKLQVSLADFRRLCIFKGIYPREPRNKKKANKGSTAPVTFYYSKDIQYLMHEPILAKFREHKTFSKKLTKALGKGQVGDAKRLESNRPKYELDHVIKERYPSFMDAVRDLDDGLNMLFLFSNMPVTNKVNAKVVKDAETLCNQWMAFVAKQRVLKKVFVSIKGVYYSANIKGQEVIWLVPFKFPHAIPSDIDFRIMLTFLEFYSTLLHFVLYRLYVDANLVYPPAINSQKLKGVGGISAYVLENREGESLLPEAKKAQAGDGEETKISSEDMQKALQADQNAKDDEPKDADENADEENVETVELDEFTDSNKNAGDILQQPSKFDHPSSTLFEGFVFFIGREVPLDILEFLIVSCGGKIVAEASLDELLLNNSSMSLDDLDFSNVTHQISDRAKVSDKVQGRTYVQPQWVFDCINKQKLVNVSDYAPGETLPPHLSPWGDAGSYNPDEAVQEIDDEEEEIVEGEVEPDQEDSDQDDEHTQRELELESAGVEFTEAEKQSLTKAQKKKKRSAKDVEDEEKELKKIMMTNKQRKLHKKMQYGIDKQEARTEQLKEKKRKLQKKKQSAK